MPNKLGIPWALTILYLISFVVLISYTELNYLHWITPNEGLFLDAGNALVMLLPFPVATVAIHLFIWVEQHVKKSPIIIVLTHNNINATYKDSIAVSVSGRFSTGSVIVSDLAEFKKSVEYVIRNIAEAGKIKLSPYVIVKNGLQLSADEIDSARRTIVNAGALTVEMS